MAKLHQKISFFLHHRSCKIPLLLLIGMALLLNACENEVEVAAPWKEVLVVYGLINPTDPVNYIKVGKAYLNQEGNALSYASNADSIIPENIDVRIQEFVNGNFTREIVFERVDADTLGISREEGVFAQNPNVLFRSDYNFKASDFLREFRYDLYVTNLKSGLSVRSSHVSVGSIEVFSPLQGNQPVINFSGEETSRLVFQYLEGRNAKSYDLKVRFRYEEWNVNDTNSKTIESVDWKVFTNKQTVSLRGFEERIVVATGKVFYELLKATIEAKPDIRRRPLGFDFYFYGGGEDLYTFINVNRPSIGIVQKKPEYSNINGGLGIFSCRHIFRYPNVRIAPEMVTSLQRSDITAALNFTY